MCQKNEAASKCPYFNCCEVCTNPDMLDASEEAKTLCIHNKIKYLEDIQSDPGHIFSKTERFTGLGLGFDISEPRHLMMRVNGYKAQLEQKLYYYNKIKKYKDEEAEKRRKARIFGFIEVYNDFKDLYDKNKVAARIKYDSINVKLSGTILDIDTDELDRMYADIQIATELDPQGEWHALVRWFFDSDRSMDIIKLRIGKTATLVGKFDSTIKPSSRKFIVRHCSVVDYETD